MKKNQFNKNLFPKKNIPVYLLWTVILIFPFCSGGDDKKNIEKNIPYLEIFFFKGAIETFASIDCDKDFLEEKNIEDKGVKVMRMFQVTL